MRAEFKDLDMSVVHKVMNINFFAGVALIKGFLPKFLNQAKQGNPPQIANTVSMCGVIGIPSRTGYSASKFAMDGFGKAL
jgi:short-subunit dehydrogenase